LEYLVRGAELGSPDASNALANAYIIDDGVAKDEKKATHYYELAAMQGHSCARHTLALMNTMLASSILLSNIG
jgi:TPR repeat protein